MSAVSPKKMSRFQPGSDDFSYEDFPFYWIALVHLTYTQKLERILKKLGTDIPTRRVLLMLDRHGTLSISDLATHVITKPSTMVRIVYRMRDEGVISTATNAEDARVTDVTITPEGEVLLDKIHQMSARIFQDVYQGLTEAQIERLNSTLAVISRNLAD